MNAIFAETLKKLRVEKGLSQKDLANQIYVTRSTVARWENGSRLPDASMISRLSNCLNVDIQNRLQLSSLGNRHFYPRTSWRVDCYVR